MQHRRNAEFRALWTSLPASVRELADKQYALLKQNPRHPSLHFKRLGGSWSVRIGRSHRALANEVEAGVFFGTGSARTTITSGSYAAPDTANPRKPPLPTRTVVPEARNTFVEIESDGEKKTRRGRTK